MQKHLLAAAMTTSCWWPVPYQAGHSAAGR